VEGEFAEVGSRPEAVALWLTTERVTQRRILMAYPEQNKQTALAFVNTAFNENKRRGKGDY
jgi:hypothetical protein